MSQSYTVFIGNSLIQFGNEPKDHSVFNRKLSDPTDKIVQEIISELEDVEQQTILITGDTEANWKRFSSNYKLIEAAGGLVENQQNEWLFIYRNNVWDLPKGKLEKGETIEKCAVREVAEECGIEEPTIAGPLTSTYHTYTLKGKRILKKTHWYKMNSHDTSRLVPQTEERISEVRWVPISKAESLAEKSFGSIKNVVSEGLCLI